MLASLRSDLFTSRRNSLFTSSEYADSFHATTEKNAFHCFSCGKQGNVLDFVAAMEQCTVRDAAVKLAEWFSISGNAAQPVPVTEPTTGPPLAREEKVGDRGEV